MSQTPLKLIFTVVITIGLLSLIGFGSLCLSLFLHTYADPAILTAIIATTSALIGYLGGILSNPRSQVMATVTTTTGDTTTSSTQPVATPVTIAPITSQAQSL